MNYPGIIPSTGLGLALDQGLRELAFKKGDPAITPFITKDETNSYYTLFCAPLLVMVYGRNLFGTHGTWGPRIESGGNEPDLELHIQSAERLTFKNLNEVLSLLRRTLPSIQISMPENLVRSDDATVFPSNSRVTIERKSLLSAFEATKEECFMRSFEKLIDWAQIFYHASAQALIDTEGFELGSYFAASVAKKELSTSPVFDTSEFPNLFQNLSGETTLSYFRGLHLPAVSSEMRLDYNLVLDIARTVGQWGCVPLCCGRPLRHP